MTEEEIKQLAEKKKKEKYCKKHCEKGTCSDLCPIIDTIECRACQDEAYTSAFIDGFEAAMNTLPHFQSKNIPDSDLIDEFRENPDLCQLYLEDMERTIKCLCGAIISRDE